MKLLSPFSISARLLPALSIGGATIQLEYSKTPGDNGRARYQYTIDLPKGKPFIANDLQSGCGGGDLQEGFSSLLSFLGAAGEAERGDENADLFPARVCKWAKENADEISLIQIEIEESKEKLIQE